jgi:Uma2 family endonuclease
MSSKWKASIADLYRVEGKAEIVGDELVLMTPTGGLHAYAITEIAASLREFAVEVRSEEDYGPAAERTMSEKRADYFAAGTLVVWDADVLKGQVVRVYRATDPTLPTIYRRGELAEAEPAVPGWSMPVEDLFPPDRT